MVCGQELRKRHDCYTRYIRRSSVQHSIMYCWLCMNTCIHRYTYVCIYVYAWMFSQVDRICRWISFQWLAAGQELDLPQKRCECFHKLLAGVVVDTLVRRHHRARVLGHPLHLLLHVACRVRATVVAPTPNPAAPFIRTCSGPRHENKEVQFEY